jgi:hypothetical protein
MSNLRMWPRPVAKYVLMFSSCNVVAVHNIDYITPEECYKARTVDETISTAESTM